MNHGGEEPEKEIQSMQSESLWSDRKPDPARTSAAARGSAPDLWQLRKIDWLRDLAAREFQELQRNASYRRHASGDQIFAPSATPESLYLLDSGLVRIYRISESGCETTLGYIAPGEVFGEVALFDRFPRESFAQAVGPAGVWRIGRDVFQRLLQARPDLLAPISRQISERLKRVEARVEDLVVRSVRSRVARMVLELSRTFGREEGDRTVIDVPLTQGELATLVGATRQTVNQVLGELTAEGSLHHDRRYLVIDDPDRLARATSTLEPT